MNRLGLCVAATTLLAACTSQSSGGLPELPRAAMDTHADLRKVIGDLFINDRGHEAVEVLKNDTWENLGAITDPIMYLEGNWVDSRGNLYVVNQDATGVYVVEYDRSRSPKFSYRVDLLYPVAVTTDSKGDVFVADWFKGIIEYRQRSNAVVASCPQLGGGQRGVAVDAHGNVFATYDSRSSSTGIAEYAGGLSGCPVTTLGVSIGTPGGIVVDKSANLVVADESNARVDVIAPPYTQVSSHLGSGYFIPVAVTLNRNNSRAYVTDWGGEEVDVLAYPSGSSIATLNSAEGLEQPVGAVDGSNYVP